MEQGILESYVNYLIWGPRSVKKIIPLHKAVALEYQRQYPQSTVRHIANGGELTLPGQFFDKKPDIVVKLSDGRYILVSVKFITATIKSNLINYWEQALGECYNMAQYECHYYVVLRYQTPAFSTRYKLKRIDVVDSSILRKFHTLADQVAIDKVKTTLIDISPFLEKEYQRFPTLRDLLETIGYSNLNLFFYQHYLPRYGYIDLNLLRIMNKWIDKQTFLIRQKVPQQRLEEIDKFFTAMKNQLMQQITVRIF